MFPGVQVRLHVLNTDLVVRKLEDGTIDVGMVEGVVDNPRILVAPCMDDELVVIMAPDHPWVKLDAIPAHCLKEYPFVAREEDSGARQVIEALLGPLGVCHGQLNTVAEMGTTESLKAAVIAGTGFGIVPLIALRKELALRSLVMRRLREGPLKRKLHFVSLKQKVRSKPVEEFLSHAQVECARIKEKLVRY